MTGQDRSSVTFWPRRLGFFGVLLERVRVRPPVVGKPPALRAALLEARLPSIGLRSWLSMMRFCRRLRVKERRR